MRTITLVALLGLLPALGQAQDKEVINNPGTALGLPLSSVVKVGNLLFLSGQIGSKPGTRGPVEGGTEAEVRQAMENIKSTLENAGSSMDRVAKCTVFLADMADFAAMNQVYSSYFPKDPPARSTVAVKGLALGAHVEIECIAVAGK
jgi:2-iminobutanoate/2-iminopropanoate deaminase